MSKVLGTVSRGLIAPIIRKGDDIAAIAVDTLLTAGKEAGFEINDGDILAITESVAARAQGNYANTEQIAQDIGSKFGNSKIGIVFPILSRNRFAVCLEGFAKNGNEIVLMLSYPHDEVGNSLVDDEALEKSGINPWQDSFSMEEFKKLFGSYNHKFTGIDYISYYDSIIKKYNPASCVVLANDAKQILKYTKNVLVCDIHTRNKTKKLLKMSGAEKVFGMDDILSQPIGESGWNSDYGLLGSNKATDSSVKLFPRDCMPIVEKIQKCIKEKTNKTIEVMIYGDGAFCDPTGKIWELADPVVSPAYTSGLEGRPNEVKLKYLADNTFKDMPQAEQQKAISAYIAECKKNQCSNIGTMVSEGTTPRKLTDLIGSLCDLTSGSGDKGTPIIYIQGYFDKYAV